MAFVLVPCRSLDGGKSRLSPVLGYAERRAFCEMLLVRTLILAKSVVEPAQIALITRDESVRLIGLAHGASVFADRGEDLNDALDGARQQLRGEQGNEAEALVLPIDLPLATAEAVRRLMASPADIAIVPDRREEGTNLLWLGRHALPLFRFAFGLRSFAAHCTLAADARLTWEAVRDPLLGFDVDTPQDFEEWRQHERT